MKIGMITDHLRGGGKERRMVELVKALSSQGQYEFIIMMTEGADENDCAYKTVFETNARFYYLGGVSKLSKPKKLLDIVNKEEIDIIHYWAPSIHAYMVLPIWFQHKVPILNSSITSARRQGGGKFWLVRMSYSLFDCILSNSQQALKVNKVPKSKAVCIYNGFDPKRAIIKRQPEEVRLQMGINSKYIVSMAGEYSYRKDWPMFVKAANQIVLQGIDVTFIAMGGGDPSQYEQIIDCDERCKKRIRFVGRETDVESVFNASDIVVHASCIEGVSNSILEGMAVGKPIVSTKGPYVGTAEIVSDGVNGFLVDYHDYVAFAEKISLLLNDEDLRIRMGHFSNSIVKERFGIDQMTNAFAQLYHKYCKR